MRNRTVGSRGPLSRAKFHAMPRGRHRHSQPLHRLLPPLTVAGSATALALGAWFTPSTGNGVVLRVLVVAVAAVACTGAYLLRTWDRAAGKEVADLRTARARDEWRAEERIAELETDVEEAREVRRRIQAKLRAKRAELSRLRGEHAELLRRYATAESERARALESRRRLALESAAAPRATSTAVDRVTPVSPAAYLRAAEALRNLGANAARQAGGGDTPVRDGRPALPAEREVPPVHQRQFARPPSPAVPSQGAARKTAPGERPAIAPASAVVPQSRAVRPPQGGFDFFGTKQSKPAAPAAEEDLADVVGDEAYADHEAARAEDVEQNPAATETEGEPEVIDLTAHDETEQLDLSMLRAQ